MSAPKKKSDAVGMKTKLFEGKRMIESELSADEHRKAGVQLADEMAKLAGLEAEEHARRAAFKGTADAAREKIERLRISVQTGRASREAEVVDMAHFASGEVVTTIKGTTKVVARRAIAAHERQVGLDLVGPPPEPKTKPAKKGKDGTIVGGANDGAPATDEPPTPEA